MEGVVNVLLQKQSQRSCVGLRPPNSPIIYTLNTLIFTLAVSAIAMPLVKLRDGELILWIVKHA